ncbi:MAG: ABC transporter permease [Bacteroidales bacterium]|nr:ABC transporter permease [Bacteroidales bacterium]
MDFWQEIFMALRRNKLRTFLTGLAISWGIFILIVLLAAGNGLMDAVGKQFSSRSTNTYTLYGGMTSKPYKGHNSNRWIPLTDKDIRLLENNFPHVDQVSPRVNSGGNAVYGNQLSPIVLSGVRPVYAKTNDVEMTMGRFIDELDEKNNEKVLVIDENVQEQLFDPEEDPVGKLIFVNDIAYKVIGVWKGNPNSGGGECFVPFSTLKKITNKDEYSMLNFTTYDLDTKEANEAFEKYLRTQLAHLHEFDPEDNSSIYIISTMLQYLQTNKIMNTLQIFIWIIGIAMLISGIVGVSNIMRITVKERTNEIGIRKAIGAKSRSILASIVVESMIITTLFGYIGMWLGMMVADLSGDIISKAQEGNMVTINIVPSIDLGIVLMATALLIVCGVLAGFFPARNAVKIKPIEAMNYR